MSIANVPDRKRIEELLAELDRIVPTEGAFVQFEQYGGGPDVSYIVGNPLGALRFGIALLKVPFAPPLKGAEEHIRDIAAEGLVLEASTIQFDHFELREAPDSRPPRHGLRHYLGVAIGYVVVALIVAALVVGAIDILRWGGGLLTR